MRVAVSASVEDGRIAAWQLTTRSGTHVRRPGWGGEVNLLAAAGLQSRPWPFHEPTDVPLDVGGGGGAKNSVAGYDFPQRVVYEYVPRLLFRVSSMRSLGAFANVLAIESAMDDLAAIAERDPVEFRLAHLTNPRSREVIETVVAMSDWYGTTEAGEAKGLGFAQFENEVSFCAVVAQVSVEDEVRLLRMWAAVDDDPSVGVGEVAMGPTAGAIANAVARALGVRIRDLPITRDRIIETIMADGGT